MAVAKQGDHATVDAAGADDGNAERVQLIEDAFEHQWSHFGQYPGSRLRDEDGVLWFESSIRHLPYNGVIRTHITEPELADAVIERTLATFRTRDVPVMWVVRPSDTPSDLGHRLAINGLDLVEDVTGMDLDLEGWTPDSGSAGVDVVDVEAPDAADDGFRHYLELLRTYWSIPEDDRQLLEGLNYYFRGERSPGRRLVAYADGEPIAKAFLNLQDLPACVAIYGVAVKPEARGRGVATSLMTMAIGMGQAAGARRMVLHSSSMAVSLYRRMGFTERCHFPVWATAALFGTHHH